MPLPSAWPLIAALSTAGAFLLLTVQAYGVAIASGAVAVLSLIRWLWETDRPVALKEVDIGGGIRLPTYVTGPRSHGWWAMVIVLIVLGMNHLMTIFSFVFVYGIHPEYWSEAADPLWLVPIVGGYGAAAGLGLLGRRLLAREKSTHWSPATQILLAAGAMGIALAIDFWSWGAHGLDPELSAQGALVYAFLVQQGMLVAVVLLMACYLAARNSRGLITRPRNTTFDVITLFLLYTAAQGSISAVLTRLLQGPI